MEELKDLLAAELNENLFFIILSNRKSNDNLTKVKIRPVKLKEEIFFQIEEFRGKQVFHQNQRKEETKEYLLQKMETDFKQLELESQMVHANVLISKKGKVTCKIKKKTVQKESEAVRDLSHNRKKRYVLEEGKPVPFLVELGVQTMDGKIVRTKYDKFRQINRYLEFVRDILPELPKNRTITIIDFGCGKSYLTFALYYYLKEVEGFDLQIIGLDLKEDVIAHCNQLAKRFAFDKLSFLVGDISSFEGVSEVDMVVTLHACDVATDYALQKAVSWGAKVIFSVPCCQHELHNQMQCSELEGVLKYGLIQERMAALLTDALRADLLETKGYETQILEFIDMEHTPKNILIRAIKRHGNKKMGQPGSGVLNDMEKQKIMTQIENVTMLFHVNPTLKKLFDTMENEDK